MNKYALFHLCLARFDKMKAQSEKTKWFHKVNNHFVLINLEDDNSDLYKIHMVNHKSIYSFMINEDCPKTSAYLDGYYPQEVIQVVVRENNNSIKFSGVTGMSDFVDFDNLHRIPVIGNYHAARENHPFWKTLFSKY